MRLTKLKLKNYRCFKNETLFHIDDLTVIIGRNDIGKSTILEALDSFFNDKIEQGDLSIDSDNSLVELTCCFEEIPAQIVLDTSVPTSPTEEGILNSDNILEVKKVFTFAARKSAGIYLVANYPNDPRLSDLLSMKNTALKNFADQNGVDLTRINKTKNPLIRERIRAHVGGGRSLRELKVDGNVDSEDNIKTIWSSLRKLLPIYSLFKVDKVLDDKDGDIQDPMKVAINEALALPEIQSLLEQVEAKIREASTDVADRTIEKLKDIDETLSEQLKSEFSKTPSYNKIFDLTLLNENNIPLNKRGSGVRRLVLLSFFQAQAEKRKAEGNAPSIIYAIEEPETSQHPNHQKLLILALIKLSARPNVQVLFSTHSANLVREIPIHSLRYISSDVNRDIVIENGKNMADGTNNDTVIEKIIKSLGILPNPTDRIKVLIYVEGNHDVDALKRYSQILNAANPNIINLMTSMEVGYVITGGSALKHYIKHKHLEGLGKPVVHIYDNDVAEYRQAVRGIVAESNPQKKAFNTRKLELENYLHQDAITEAYAENGLNNLSLAAISDTMDVPLMVAEKIYTKDGADWGALPHEDQKDRGTDKKKFLNTKAVEKMTVERIRQRGGYDELVLWFNTIRELINTQM